MQTDEPQPVDPAAPAWRPRRRRTTLLGSLRRITLLLAFAFVSFWAAIPQFGNGARPSANRSAALATLKNLASAQQQFQRACAVDRDGDGVGEFGYLAELAGAVDLPGRASTAAEPDAGRLAPPVMSQAFGMLRHGAVRRSGYRFRVYLPGPGCMWLGEAARGGRSSDYVDPDLAEQRWLAYAWPDPQRRRSRFDATMLVTESGEVLRADPDDAPWRGDREPRPGVAGFVLDDDGWRLARDEADANGVSWSVAR